MYTEQDNGGSTTATTTNKGVTTGGAKGVRKRANTGIFMYYDRALLGARGAPL